MSETDPIAREGRTMRQLCRLFKIERLGALDRRAGDVRQRVIQRRWALLDELLWLERGRISASPRSSTFEQALAALAQEVNASLPAAQRRLQRLDRDLRLRLGEGQPTGVRDNANGRFLGKS
jgi:hypothetical protein